MDKDKQILNDIETAKRRLNKHGSMSPQEEKSYNFLNNLALAILLKELKDE